MLGLAVAIGCINHLWIRLPPAIGMLLGSLMQSAFVVSSDHLLDLHVMRWFRGTLTTSFLLEILQAFMRPRNEREDDPGKALGIWTGLVQRVLIEQPRPFDVDAAEAAYASQ